MTYIVFEEPSELRDVAALPAFGRDGLIGFVTTLTRAFGVSTPILSRAVMVLTIFAALLGLQQFGAVHRRSPRVDISQTFRVADVSQDGSVQPKAINWDGR